MARGASSSPSTSPVRRPRHSPQREAPRATAERGGPPGKGSEARSRATVARWSHANPPANRPRAGTDRWNKYGGHGGRKVTTQAGWGNKYRWKSAGPKGGWQTRCCHDADAGSWTAASSGGTPPPTPALPALPALPAPDAEEAPPPLMVPGVADAGPGKEAAGAAGERGAGEAVEGEVPAGCRLSAVVLQGLRDAGWVRMPRGWDGHGEPTWWFPATAQRVPEAQIKP